MGKLIYIMGKSATGKDSVYQALRERFPRLRPWVSYTTRPRREGETEGLEYHFIDEAALQRFASEGRLIEKRVYQTVKGPWTYATLDDGLLNGPDGELFIGIGTLESYGQLVRYFGQDKVVPVYLETDDEERLLRAVRREAKEASPNYAEVCRRYLADEADFSEERLKEAGIRVRYRNRDLLHCLDEIAGVVVNYA